MESRRERTSRKFEDLKKGVIEEEGRKQAETQAPPTAPPGVTVPPPDIGEVLYMLLANQLTILESLLLRTVVQERAGFEIDSKREKEQVVMMRGQTKGLLERMRVAPATEPEGGKKDEGD